VTLSCEERLFRGVPWGSYYSLGGHYLSGEELSESSDAGSCSDFGRYRRVELLNHVGYVVVTIVASLGLLGWDAFRRLAASSTLVLPLMAAVAASLVAYFSSRVVRFTRSPVILPDPVSLPDDA
jgi:hypothetical protein